MCQKPQFFWSAVIMGTKAPIGVSNLTESNHALKIQNFTHLDQLSILVTGRIEIEIGSLRGITWFAIRPMLLGIKTSDVIGGISHPCRGGEL